MTNIQYRKAKLEDLDMIINLLKEDELAKNREDVSSNHSYIEAFEKISNDKNQYLMVAEINNEIVGTSHLTFMPSLTYTGSTRLNVEAVRVSKKHRGKQIGHMIFDKIKDIAQENNIKIIQLTTNKKRDRAIKFYESLGYKASHYGMKLFI